MWIWRERIAYNHNINTGNLNIIKKVNRYIKEFDM